MKYTLSLHDIKIFSRIGVSDHEREKKQELRVDIDLQKDLSLACGSDAISDTINYDEMIEHCNEVARGEYHLIETLVYAIFQKIWSTFSPDFLKVTLKKRARTDLLFASITLESENR